MALNNRQARSFVILLSIPFMWGITFPLIHQLANSYNPVLFVFWRFVLAAFVMLPLFIFSAQPRQIIIRDVAYGAVIGIINSGAFISQF